jgi:hypothetical protein
MDASVEETELDVGSASDELESSVAEPRLARRPTPRPFTIESLIGGVHDSHDTGAGGGSIARDDRANGSEEEEHRDREYQLYQRHYLATAAASTLPSSESFLSRSLARCSLSLGAFVLLPIRGSKIRAGKFDGIRLDIISCRISSVTG